MTLSNSRRDLILRYVTLKIVSVFRCNNFRSHGTLTYLFLVRIKVRPTAHSTSVVRHACRTVKLVETERERAMLKISVRHKLCSGWATKESSVLIHVHGKAGQKKRSQSCCAFCSAWFGLFLIAACGQERLPLGCVMYPTVDAAKITYTTKCAEESIVRNSTYLFADLPLVRILFMKYVIFSVPSMAQQNYMFGSRCNQLLQNAQQNYRSDCRTN